MADASRLRESLTERVRERYPEMSDAVAEALRTVPRHLFLPDTPLELVYRDEPIVTRRDSAGVPISSSSQPTIMAIMLDQLGLEPGRRVLEIGAGTGYNAALIAHLVGPGGAVVTVDIDADLVERAGEHLRRAGFPAVAVVCADGVEGFPAGGPYDRVIATVGVWDLAPAWLDQLAPEGRIVVPLDLYGVQCTVALVREEDHWVSRSVRLCGFMRLRGTHAGPEPTRVLDRGSMLALMFPVDRPVSEEKVRDLLAGVPAVRGTGMSVSFAELTGGLSVWLAVHEPRWCLISEMGTAISAGPPAESAEPTAEPTAETTGETTGETPTASSVESPAAGSATARTPPPLEGLRPAGVRLALTLGVLDDDALCLLAAEPDSPLSVYAYGPGGPGLAEDLAAHLRAWQEAGRPGTDDLRVAAHPSNAPIEIPPDAVTIEKRHTVLALSWAPA